MSSLNRTGGLRHHQLTMQLDIPVKDSPPAGYWKAKEQDMSPRDAFLGKLRRGHLAVLDDTLQHHTSELYTLSVHPMSIA